MPSLSIERLARIANTPAIKIPCRASTTAALPSLYGLLTVDDVTLAAGDRVLVRHQSNAIENGVYLVTVDYWTRASDANEPQDLVDGTLVFVTEGTTWGQFEFRLQATDPVTPGTTAQTWQPTILLGGDVQGPASSTDGRLAVFDGTSGKVIREYGAADLAVADGGTGASDAATARANLGASAVTRTINTQSGTSYTLGLSDAGNVVYRTSATDNTTTVPTNATAAFPIGTQVDLVQAGVGAMLISPAGGVTINSFDGNATLAGEWATATLLKTGVDEWLLFGNLTA